eukprot:6211410-Pleurochrysis_carterae.AAC.1
MVILQGIIQILRAISSNLSLVPIRARLRPCERGRPNHQSARCAAGATIKELEQIFSLASPAALLPVATASFSALGNDNYTVIAFFTSGPNHTIHTESAHCLPVALQSHPRFM